MRVIRSVGALLVFLAAIIAIAWAFGAVWFDAPFGAINRIAAALLATTFVVVLLFVRPFRRKLAAVHNWPFWRWQRAPLGQRMPTKNSKAFSGLLKY
jgi:hypothetical protein